MPRMLVVTWLNATRYYVVLHTKITIGADLFFKLGIISTDMLNCICVLCSQSHGKSGSSLPRVDFPTANLAPQYSGRTKVVKTVYWALLTWNLIYYIFTVCISDDILISYHNDILLLHFTKTFTILNPYANIMKAVFSVPQLEALAAWAFAQSVVTYLLYRW